MLEAWWVFRVYTSGHGWCTRRWVPLPMLILSPTGFILFPLWVEFFADALLCPNCGTDFLLRVSPSGNVQTCPLFLLAKLLGTVFAELKPGDHRGAGWWVQLLHLLRQGADAPGHQEGPTLVLGKCRHRGGYRLPQLGLGWAQNPDSNLATTWDHSRNVATPYPSCPCQELTKPQVI